MEAVGSPDPTQTCYCLPPDAHPGTVASFLTSVSEYCSQIFLVVVTLDCACQCHLPCIRPVPNQSFDSVSPFATIFLPISPFAVAKLIWGKPSDGSDRTLVSFWESSGLAFIRACTNPGMCCHPCSIFCSGYLINMKHQTSLDMPLPNYLMVGYSTVY